MRTDTPHPIMIIPRGIPRTAVPSSARAASRTAEAANADRPRLRFSQRADNPGGDDAYRQLLMG
jgi:hypothetical protein